jgi:hypothetical protein
MYNQAGNFYTADKKHKRAEEMNIAALYLRGLTSGGAGDAIIDQAQKGYNDLFEKVNEDELRKSELKVLWSNLEAIRETLTAA